MIGGLGDEVPKKQKLVSYQSTDSSSFCEFHYSKNLSVIGITKCEKKFDHRLGGGPWPPVAPPGSATGRWMRFFHIPVTFLFSFRRPYFHTTDSRLSYDQRPTFTDRHITRPTFFFHICERRTDARSIFTRLTPDFYTTKIGHVPIDPIDFHAFLTFTRPADVRAIFKIYRRSHDRHDTIIFIRSLFNDESAPYGLFIVSNEYIPSTVC